MNTNAQLTIGIPSVSEDLNHLEIHSVSEYVIFDDILRSLVKYDSNGAIAPDLAESWEINNQYKEFILKLKKNQRFSDKSFITASEVMMSLQNTFSHPGIIHGNEEKIKNISKIDESSIKIELLESNPFFLTKLASPEYRIVKKSDEKYNATSGPYYIERKNNSKNIKLKLNEYFPFETSVKYKEIEYISYQDLGEKELKKFDIIWPKSSMSLKEIKKVESNGYYIYKLNLGFSYWLSLNPNTLELDERIQIKKKLDQTLENLPFFADNNLSRSRQLFLPYGPGRLTDNEINSINQTHTNKTLIKIKKLKILLPQIIQVELLTNLKSIFENAEISFYSDFSEYSKLIKLKKFDVSLVNNDLSSIDLRSSIIVTFNPSRPLVWIEENNKEYLELLRNINTEMISLKRYASIKRLSENLLRDVIVYPLYYDYGFVLAKNSIDLSQLNKSGSETLSWKIK